MSSEERISSGKWGGNRELWTAGGKCLCLIARNSSFLRLGPLHFTTDAAMNFSTSRSRAANKLSKTMPEEERKKKKRRFTSWIFRYLVYSCCKVVWKCSDEYRELNLMPDITPGKHGVPEKRRSDPREA
ncbi:hypothetical protein CDAR_70091 [Caerostris darwini]|uniref:Uncharacterized protein n=1 Tax=Caerostris darwini TaxID=1538125 RepID=A0AAV4RCU9_9ARAC|nr:hypothetical protein CDAR_70091 [Caerostris darwini]